MAGEELMFRPDMKSALLPAVLIWLALHAALLSLFLAIRFLSAKVMLLALLLAGAAWFLMRPRPARLMPPRSVVV